MHILKYVLPLLFLGLLAGKTFAQEPLKPIGVSKYNTLIHRHPMAVRPDLDVQAREAVQRSNVQSVPYWTAAFNYQGTNYPLWLVGQSVFSGKLAVVEVPVITLKFRFLDYIDPSTGNPYELDATPQTPDILNSPNFAFVQYPTGMTQFQDAAQRASFYGYYNDQWHTLLNPQPRPTFVIDVPADKAVVFYLIEDPSIIGAIVDRAWAEAQFMTVITALHIPVESFPVMISHNVFLAADADPSFCCVTGEHGAYVSKLVGIKYYIQTWAWADWTSPELSFFGTRDAFALSHEIAEWTNDPFVANVVPRWQWVDYYNYSTCSLARETALFEVADPVQNYPGYAITAHGFTYSMTNEVLLPWFTRDVPSKALHGAYSFPDETIATGPSLSCP